MGSFAEKKKLSQIKGKRMVQGSVRWYRGVPGGERTGQGKNLLWMEKKTDGIPSSCR